MRDLRRRLAGAPAPKRAPTIVVAPEAIDYWLDACGRAVVDEAVVMYARSMAGTAADLDTDLEAAALEQLDRIDGTN